MAHRSPSSRSVLTTLCAVPALAALLVACGSSDRSRKPSPVDAGADADAALAHDSSTVPPKPDAGHPKPDAGTPRTDSGAPVPDASVPPDASVAPEAGTDSGTPLPQLVTLFSVGAGSHGVTGSGVASLSSPEGAIYSSAGSGVEHVAGTNTLRVTPDLLGLAATDDVDAIAVLKPTPQYPLYYFSVRAGGPTQGLPFTHVDRQTSLGNVQNDLFYSDGAGITTPSPGYDALFTDGAQLGLLPTAPPPKVDAGPQQADELDALEIGAPFTPTALYFSVTRRAAGLAGSAVAGVTAAQRGCTVFRSALDGKSTVAATCDALGLTDGDELDALAVVSSGTPEYLFSVDQSAVGKAGTAVNSQSSYGFPGSDIFASTGDGTNTLRVNHSDLGLLPGPGTGQGPYDDLDALAVIDTPRFPSYLNGAGCTLSPDPLAAPDGSVTSNRIEAVSYVKDGIAMVTWVDLNRTTHFGFYDVTKTGTCPSVGTEVTTTLFTLTVAGAVGIPTAGWTKTDPSANLDIWAFQPGDGAYADLYRVGDRVSVTLDGFNAGGDALVYDAANSRFVVVHPDTLGRCQDAPCRYALVLPLLGSAGMQNQLDSTVSASSYLELPVPRPCNGPLVATGADPVTGTLHFLNPNERYQRGCDLTSDLYFTNPPRPWTSATPTPTFDRGMIVPGVGLYAVTYGTGTTGTRVTLYPAAP
jgi:hypothetical protein